MGLQPCIRTNQSRTSPAAERRAPQRDDGSLQNHGSRRGERGASLIAPLLIRATSSSILPATIGSTGLPGCGAARARSGRPPGPRPHTRSSAHGSRQRHRHAAPVLAPEQPPAAGGGRCSKPVRQPQAAASSGMSEAPGFSRGASTSLSTWAGRVDKQRLWIRDHNTKPAGCRLVPEELPLPWAEPATLVGCFSGGPGRRQRRRHCKRYGRSGHIASAGVALGAGRWGDPLGIMSVR